MTERNLVPVPEQQQEEQKPMKPARLERRQRLIERRNRVAAKREERQRREAVAAEMAETTPAPTNPAGPAAPSTTTAETFVLPPRAEMNRGSSAYSRFLKVSFFLIVALPTLVTMLFYFFFASEQFATQSMFAVRGSAASAVDGASGGLFGGGAVGGAGPEYADSFIVQEFIQSREMVRALVDEANFLEVYSRPTADPYYRLDPTSSIEDLVSYWQMMIEVEFDIETGIINLTVRAFRPADAASITDKVIEKSEELVNELSLRAREDSVRSAQREVDIAEQRFSDSRKAVAAFRGSERELDTEAVASARQGLISDLEKEVADLEAQLTALRTTMSDNSPRVVYVRNQIDALRRQIASERLRVAVQGEGEDQPSITDRLSRYEELLAEREFAEKSYISTLSTLESARVEALKQQRYLAVFVQGSAPDDATYPEAWRWTAILFATLFLLWGTMAVISAALRDRMV